MIKFQDTCFIHPKATMHGTGIILGDNVTLWANAVLRADRGGSISIGNNTNVQEGTIIHSSTPKHPVIIGNHVTLELGAIVHGADIGNFVCVSTSAVVLPGCLLEDNLILGYGSVAVPHSVFKSGWLYLGNPAKPVRELTRQELDWLKSNAEDYVGLGRENLAGKYKLN